MANNVLNISGLVYQGAVLITAGYVRAQNLNIPSMVKVAAIGTYETGDLEAGRYDVWFRSLTEQAFVCNVGDVIELSVYNLQASITDLQAETVAPSVNVNRLFPPKTLPVLTEAQVNASYVAYNIQGVTNELPGLPIINAAENIQFTNSKNIEWIWKCPTDSDGDTIHFQLEWSLDPSFPLIAGTNRYDTRNSNDAAMFSYESADGIWKAFPLSGLPNAHYNKRCRFKITLSSDGTYYWRVRATDNVDR